MMHGRWCMRRRNCLGGIDWTAQPICCTSMCPESSCGECARAAHLRSASLLPAQETWTCLSAHAAWVQGESWSKKGHTVEKAQEQDCAYTSAT